MYTVQVQDDSRTGLMRMPKATDQILVLDQVCHFLSVRYGEPVTAEWVAIKLAGKRISQIGPLKHGVPKFAVRVRRHLGPSKRRAEDQVLVQPAGDEWVAVGVVERKSKTG